MPSKNEHKKPQWDYQTRKRVIQMHENHISTRDVRVALGVPPRTQHRIIKLGPERRKGSGRPPKADCDLKRKRRKKPEEREKRPEKQPKQPRPKRIRRSAKTIRIEAERRSRIEQLNNTFDSPAVPPRHFHNFSSLDLFHQLCSQTASSETYPLSDALISNIPIYDAQNLFLTNDRITSMIQDEWHHILQDGPGVFVLRGMFPAALLDTTNTIFDSIIEKERSSNGQGGDHFSANNTNSRIWNSFGKHGSANPKSFLDYYSSPLLALVCEAWLGPAYRVTAQVNIVNPGGAHQVCHRDYHLGFQTAETCGRYPATLQMASQFLTLQGAVAHSNMPIESGPTRFLPFSQQFAQGYTAYRQSEFKDYFDRTYVTLPLRKGDAIFFNPALFHAAGENTLQDFRRIANLLQISSAFGKPMEAVDSLGLIMGCWPLLQSKFGKEGMSKQVEAFVTAVADGYPFPTNLDKRPPCGGGLAPESQQELVFSALKEQWPRERLQSALVTMREDSFA
ncbi:MAG: hypothetical protein M1812_008281 [Candelaria pacifica]|nr:MAG: hypothetical protein M1812_008281 [Candelaria pacifica]